jgi:hypothetical protein
LSSGLDPDYFSPLESAYAFHSKLTPATNKKIDDPFRVMSFRNPIVPNAAVTGYRGVLVLDRRPFSFGDIQSFNWESPISDRIKRLTIPLQRDFDEQR